jgi:hypothetical protein
VIICAATGGAFTGLLLVAAVVLVLRARRNANAMPTGVHAPLAANAAPAGLHAPLAANAAPAGSRTSRFFGPHAAAGGSQRPRCENDGSCYRQNPAHWADFHHANQHAPVDRPVKGAANAAPAGVHAPLTANAAPAGLHAPLAANASPAGVHQSQHFGPPSASGASQRPRCENDGSCYRQNPAHWADFHHVNQHAPVDKPVQGAAK